MTDARTRGALIAAALVGAFLLVQEIVGSIASLGYAYAQEGPRYVGTIFGGTTLDLFTRILPIAVGVFLVFWRFLAPITADLTLRRVLVRSLVATAAGTVIELVVSTIVDGLRSFTGYLFGNSFPFADVGNGFSSFVNSLVSAVTGFVGLVPLVALAAVLLWLWLRGRRV